MRDNLTQVIHHQLKEVFKDHETKLNEKFEQVYEKLELQKKEVEEVIKSQEHINAEYEEIKKKLEEKTKENSMIMQKN